MMENLFEKILHTTKDVKGSTNTFIPSRHDKITSHLNLDVYHTEKVKKEKEGEGEKFNHEN